jgi:hypothetical protein
VVRIDWQNDPTAPMPCRVVNLDTGEVLSPCAMADEETGEYIRYAQPFQIDQKTKLVKTERGKARIRIEVLPPLPQNFASHFGATSVCEDRA